MSDLYFVIFLVVCAFAGIIAAEIKIGLDRNRFRRPPTYGMSKKERKAYYAIREEWRMNELKRRFPEAFDYEVFKEKVKKGAANGKE